MQTGCTAVSANFKGTTTSCSPSQLMTSDSSWSAITSRFGSCFGKRDSQNFAPYTGDTCCFIISVVDGSNVSSSIHFTVRFFVPKPTEPNAQ